MMQYTNWINTTPSQQKLLTLLAQWLEHLVYNLGVAGLSLTISRGIGPGKLCENIIEKKRYGRPVHFKMEIAEWTDITSFDCKILSASLHIHCRQNGMLSSNGNTVNVLMLWKAMKFSPPWGFFTMAKTNNELWGRQKSSHFENGVRLRRLRSDLLDPKFGSQISALLWLKSHTFSET